MENTQNRFAEAQSIKYQIIECIMKSDDTALNDLILKLLLSSVPD